MVSSEIITAIIPTLANKKGLFNLLKELKQVPDLQVIVIDNDPSESKKKTTINNQYSYFPQDENLGFAKAINLGAKKARTKWLLILNDDLCGLNKRVLSRLLTTAQTHNWQAVSPILKNSKGETENIGYKVLPIGKVQLNFDPNQSDSTQLDGLTAACLLIKKEVFERVGGFDETFFAYLEDVDLFMTLKEKGYHFGVDVDEEVMHHHLTTSSLQKGFKEKQDVKNWWRIFIKHRRVKFSLRFLVERGRNISGLLKSLSQKNYDKI